MELYHQHLYPATFLGNTPMQPEGGTHHLRFPFSFMSCDELARELGCPTSGHEQVQLSL